jgi:hypothetical protein
VRSNVLFFGHHVRVWALQIPKSSQAEINSASNMFFSKSFSLVAKCGRIG